MEVEDGDSGFDSLEDLSVDAVPPADANAAASSAVESTSVVPVDPTQAETMPFDFEGAGIALGTIPIPLAGKGLDKSLALPTAPDAIDERIRFLE